MLQRKTPDGEDYQPPIHQLRVPIFLILGRFTPKFPEGVLSSMCPVGTILNTPEAYTAKWARRGSEGDWRSESTMRQCRPHIARS